MHHVNRLSQATWTWRNHQHSRRGRGFCTFYFCFYLTCITCIYHLRKMESKSCKLSLFSWLRTLNLTWRCVESERRERESMRHHQAASMQSTVATVTACNRPHGLRSSDGERAQEKRKGEKRHPFAPAKGTLCYFFLTQSIHKFTWKMPARRERKEMRRVEKRLVTRRRREQLH